MQIPLAFGALITQYLAARVIAADVCGLHSQSGLVVRNRLYYQGGLYRSADGSTFPTPAELRWLQLDQPFAVEGGVPGNLTSSKALASSSNSQQSYVGTGGVLWTDANAIFVYRMAGFSDDNGQGQSTLPAYNIAKDQWQSISVSGGNFNRFDRHFSVHASSAEAGGSLSFVSGGQDYVGGMVALNSSNPQAPSWRNSTSSDQPYFYSAVSEFVRYGSAGIIVSVGGFVTESSPNVVAQRREMNSVQIYDIAGEKWSTIYATGDLPPTRSRACSSISAAQDDSVFVLTVYGGWDEENALNDVYQLIMPAFHWIKVNTTTPGLQAGDPGTGRMDHFCSATNNGRYMLSLGGKQQLSPKSNKCDTGYPALRLLDLTTFQWQTTYAPSQLGYSVPKAVSDVVGGGPDGGARSSDTWADIQQSTKALFSRKISKYDPDHPTNTNANKGQPLPGIAETGGTSSSDNHGIGKGAIAGAVAGSVIGSAFLGLAALLLVRRARRRAQATNAQDIIWSNSGSGPYPVQETKFVSEAMGDIPSMYPSAELDGNSQTAELPGASSNLSFSPVDGQSRGKR